MIGKYFGIIAILFLILGFTMPENFKWVLSKVGGISVLTFLLGIVMFGMGTTLSVKDFVLVFKRPRDVFLGAVAQFFIMPFLAFSLATIFQLDPALTAGVILVGTCPGGTSSNVITFMSKGDVALSVTMTYNNHKKLKQGVLISCCVFTVLSPILTPAITYLLIGTKIAFDPVGMFLSIVQIVIVPICLGVAVKTFLPKLAAAATDYTPAISSIAISLIIAGVIGASKNAIVANFGIILLVVILHNCLGYALGFAVARLTGLSWKKAVALSIEVGMQNSGLAVGLAKAHFAAMPAATVPGAIFSAWHNISGAMLAWLYVNVLNPRFDPELRKEMEALRAPAKELA